MVTKAMLSAKNQTHLGSVVTLREAYDYTYGISSIEEISNPNSTFMMKYHEDSVTDGSVMVLMNRIITSKLPSLTGMSLLELMEMPPSLLDPLLKTANSKVQGEARAADELLSNLEE